MTIGTGRYRCVIAGCVSVIFISTFYLIGPVYQDDQEFKQDQIKMSAQYADSGKIDVWTNRTSQLQKGCYQSTRKEYYRIKYQQGQALFFQSQNLNISVCKVAKAGSTFWAIVFLIVDKGLPAAEAFGISRSKIHGLSSGLTKHMPPHPQPLGTKGVVVSRDPYSRLFSAFIDKFFLLRFPQTAQALARSLGKGYFMTDAGKCGYDVSFQDFVDSETTKALQGAKINRHWCPVYTLCRVCDVEYQYVIKQETLTKDTEYIMSQLDISNDVKATLTNMFHGSGTNKAMEGVIETMWNDHDSKTMQACCNNKLAFFMKMWEGFKIQGYIKTDKPFPISTFKDENSVNLETITKAVLSEMTTHPLSSTERKAQRRQALVEAYKVMPKRILSQIQEMYKMDFYLFSYDINPPV